MLMGLSQKALWWVQGLLCTLTRTPNTTGEKSGPTLSSCSRRTPGRFDERASTCPTAGRSTSLLDPAVERGMIDFRLTWMEAAILLVCLPQGGAEEWSSDRWLAAYHGVADQQHYGTTACTLNRVAGQVAAGFASHAGMSGSSAPPPTVILAPSASRTGPSGGLVKTISLVLLSHATSALRHTSVMSRLTASTCSVTHSGPIWSVPGPSPAPPPAVAGSSTTARGPQRDPWRSSVGVRVVADSEMVQPLAATRTRPAPVSQRRILLPLIISDTPPHRALHPDSRPLTTYHA